VHLLSLVWARGRQGESQAGLSALLAVQGAPSAAAAAADPIAQAVGPDELELMVGRHTRMVAVNRQLWWLFPSQTGFQ